jgi:hypothetical protein
MTAASATRTAITKSLITSLAKCRKGPRNINMSTNHSLPQRPASHRFASEPQVTQSQTPDYDARRDRGREGHQYPRVARAKPGASQVGPPPGPGQALCHRSDHNQYLFSTALTLELGSSRAPPPN